VREATVETETAIVDGPRPSAGDRPDGPHRPRKQGGGPRATLARWRAAVRSAPRKRWAYEIFLIVWIASEAGGVAFLLDRPEGLPAASPYPELVLVIVATVATAVVVPLRHVWPVGVYLAAGVMVAATGGASYSLLVLVSVGLGYRTTGYLRPTLASVAGLACWLVAVTVWVDLGGALRLIVATACFLPTVVPTIIGRLIAQRRFLVNTMNDSHLRLHREQTAIAQQARSRERTRIARDLHDSLGHQLTLISMYAGALPSVPESQREETYGLLRSTSAKAMTELRQILGVLGQDEDAADMGTARPLSSMPDVVEAARSAGAQVSLTQVGAPQPLPLLVDHAAYRMIQEGVTNALRHAAGGPIDVNVRYDSDTLVVEVVNGPGAPHPGPTSGQGLIGLAERVRLAGGVLYHGPVSGGGFRLAAMLPYHSGEPASPDTLPAPIGDFSQDIRRSGRRTVYGVVGICAAIVAMAVLCIAAVILLPDGAENAVDRATYDAAHEGAPEAEVRDTLPDPTSGVRDGIGGGQIPEGATCVDYPAEARVQLQNDHDNSDVVYRFCFRDGKLLSKKTYMNRNT
jgi:signal transduction histidine kinase